MTQCEPLKVTSLSEEYVLAKSEPATCFTTMSSEPEALHELLTAEYISFEMSVSQNNSGALLAFQFLEN